MTEEVRLYSTVAGELVKLVQTETPKCFVEYEQYLVLEKAYKELMEEHNDNRESKANPYHKHQ